MVQPSQPWIALVKRGECDYVQKVKIATEKYNASAVIVYDNLDASSELIIMNDMDEGN